tara:strand:+ start:1008 stop:1451 length:444 start_codon:yes stop_codon:yes gene_type:complete
MAHFAKIENNIIVKIEVVHNDIATDEQAGITFLQNLYNDTATWKQTSYNTYQNTHKLSGTAFRGNYAGINFIWDADNNIFLPPKPFASWTKHISSATWRSPLGNAPDFTEEQVSQNNANSHAWVYSWDESAYQSDNSTGWVLIDLKA